jgi:hypothetical protein
MSIELFAGKSNIFESNQGYQKILSEIHPSHTVPQDTKLSGGEDLQRVPNPKENHL